MPEDRRRDDRPGDPAEGVRIIGAEEAAEAIERGDVAPRRGSHLPRYGDRPARPPAGSPKPALRFPLDAGADPTESAQVRPARGIRFEPRPAPTWDEPAPEAAGDDAGAEEAWPDESGWAESDDWGEPQADVAAWTRGETGAVPAVEVSESADAADADDAADAGSWADEFADDEDPWDGSWDEPTGTVQWADEAPAAEVAAGGSPDPDDDAELDEDAAWAAFTEVADAADAEAAGAPGEPEVGGAETVVVDDRSDAVAGVDDADDVDDVDDDTTLSGQRPPLFDPAGGWADGEGEAGPVFDFADEPSGQVELPHWTDPPTGELPKVLVDDDADPVAAAPTVHWRDHDGAWGGDDLDDLAGLGDEVRVGALDTERPHHDDMYDFGDDDELVEAPPVVTRRVPPPRPEPELTGPSTGAGRNVGVAAGVGVGAAVVALVAFAIGSVAAMALIVVVLTLGVIEYQNAVRRAGYRPAALFGIVAAVCIPLAVYWRGEGAYPLIAFLTVATALAWHLAGADRGARVVESAGVTLLGIGWVVGLGSFAALLLTRPDGLGLLIGAIVATVGYDVGGYAVGRSMGTRPLSAASPNKTVEGLVGGMICSLVAMLILGLFGPAPFDVGLGLQIGFLAALAAPLGDLCESLVKRDLGIKDMGSLLPEHGGVLDRFDALLFVLPAVYYGAVLFQ